jgi:hypothetical protein
MMTEYEFIAILIVIGAIACVLLNVVAIGGFVLVSRFLPRPSGMNGLGVWHLLGYLLVACITGGCLIGFVLLTVNWTNEFPQFATSKRAFWIGMLIGFGISRWMGRWGRKDLRPE